MKMMYFEQCFSTLMFTFLPNRLPKVSLAVSQGTLLDVDEAKISE
jgi:hypothetical protein